MTLSRPFKESRSTLSYFYASLIQAIDGVVSLTIRSQVVSQATQHARSSETQVTYNAEEEGEEDDEQGLIYDI